MKIALIGASGFIGSALREEAVGRGHQVTALVSQPGKLNATASNLTVKQVDVQDTAQLTDTLTGADVVISAFSGHAQDDIRGYYVQGVKSIIASVKAADVARLVIVGGAGSLRVAADTLLIDTPAFPEEYKPTALGAQDALALLQAEPAVNWTMLSPAAEIFPGERTNQFRLGLDDLLVDDEGNSRISVQDYAVALLDEVDHPQHERQRFTLAY